MTARGSSPTHEALTLERIARHLRSRYHQWDGEEMRPWDKIGEDRLGWLDLASEVLDLADAVYGLPALRREAAALALEDAAEFVDVVGTGNGFTGVQMLVEGLRARAAALREGR